MVILKEKEVLDYLQIPNVPKKEWDGKTSFKDGVAIVNLYGGKQMYAIATFDAETDTNPRIKKVFSGEPFYDVVNVFVVPSYMAKEEDVENFDIDEQSKVAAIALLEEAKELENAGVEEKPFEDDNSNSNEWVFDEIHNMEEARAWIKSYNHKNRINKNRIPKDEESMKLRLLAISKEMEKQNKK